LLTGLRRLDPAAILRASLERRRADAAAASATQRELDPQLLAAQVQVIERHEVPRSAVVAVVSPRAEAIGEEADARKQVAEVSRFVAAYRAAQSAGAGGTGRRSQPSAAEHVVDAVAQRAVAAYALQRSLAESRTASERLLDVRA
jgi:hypothetical protein